MDPDGKDGETRLTPLIRAAGGGHVDVAESLLEAGAQVDMRGCNENTALMAANVCVVRGSCSSVCFWNFVQLTLTVPCIANDPAFAGFDLTQALHQQPRLKWCRCS